ncbi:hypothetical protein GQ457_03G039430 [Hibiscus cannabinus]
MSPAGKHPVKDTQACRPQFVMSSLMDPTESCHIPGHLILDMPYLEFDLRDLLIFRNTISKRLLILQQIYSKHTAKNEQADNTIDHTARNNGVMRKQFH